MTVPNSGPSSLNLRVLLEEMIEKGASDLHITAGERPKIRVDGDITNSSIDIVLQPKDCMQLAYSVLTENQKKRFEMDDELDFSFGIQNLARFRGKSFQASLKYALRQDPDVVLIGEMRDLETIQAGLTIAETGHIAFATLHTNSAAEAINRIIDVFPSYQQSQVRAQLAFCLEGIITQTLLPKMKGRGRAMAAEILVVTPAIRALIRDDKIHQIYSMMQSGKKYGMQTMNDALYQLYMSREVAWEEVISASHDPIELARMCNMQIDGMEMPDEGNKKQAVGGGKPLG